MKKFSFIAALTLFHISTIGCEDKSGYQDFELPQDQDGEPNRDDWDNDDGGLNVDDGDHTNNCSESDQTKDVFEENWRTVVSNHFNILPPAVDTNNEIYFVAGGCDFGDCPYELYKVDPINGEVEWSKITGPGVPVIDSEGRIILCSNKIHSFSNNGELICEKELSLDPNELLGIPVLGNDGKMLLFHKEKIISISPEDCNTVDMTELLNWSNGALAIGSTGQIYVAGSKGIISIVNNGGGYETEWHMDELVTEGDPLAIDNNGNLVVITVAKTLAKISPSGQKLWEENLGSCKTSTPVIDQSGNIFLSGIGGLIAFDKNGKEMWKHGNGVSGGPDCFIGFAPAPIINCNGNVLYLNTSFMKIVMLDANGQVLKEKDIDGGVHTHCVTIASLAVVTDGVLVGNCQSTMINLFKDVTGLDDSWSKYRNDSRNTGNATQ